MYDTSARVSLASGCCVHELTRSISRSDKGKARVAVLFSGGIDSAVLTYLAHRSALFFSDNDSQADSRLLDMFR